MSEEKHDESKDGIDRLDVEMQAGPREYTEEELAGPKKPGVLESLLEVVGEKKTEDPELVKERHRHRFDGKAGVVLAAHKTETLETFTQLEVGADLEIHEAPIQLLAADLETDPSAGMKSAAAAKRLQEDGPNELEKPPRITLCMLFLVQLTQFIIVLLLAAAIASAIINVIAGNGGNPLAYVDSIAIFIIVFLNAIIGAVTENAANGALDALSALSSPISTVVRDGEETEVPSANIVRGDIVVLTTGDVVPADSRLLEAADLKVNEMLLTGESEDVSKTAKVKKKVAGAAEKLTPETMVFSSCTVKNGNAKALVVRTGMQTRVGQIAALLTEDKSEKKGCLPDTSGNQTPLQVELGKLAVQIGFLAVACCTIVFVVGVGVNAQDADRPEIPSWLFMILIAVTLTVAAIPEGLPLCVTISLSTGCSDMVKENVLMRKIAAVETLGSASVICTDKTGTLTEGKMTMVKMWSSSNDFVLSGKGFDPTSGAIARGGAVAADEVNFDPADVRNDDPRVRSTLISALLCSNASLSRNEEGFWTPRGNSSEAPIVVAGAKIGVWSADLEKIYERVAEIPFSSSRKMMVCVVEPSTKNADKAKLDGLVPALRFDAPRVAHVKGAPNYILDKASFVLNDVGGGSPDVVPMTPQMKADVLAKVDELSSQALRVLAVAMRPVDDTSKLPEDVDAKFALLVHDLTLVGLVASIDPERDGVKQAVLDADSAHVRTVMITGDYLKTAQAIAKNISILPPDGSLDVTGAVDCNSLRPSGDYLPLTEMDELTSRVNVFARAKPEDKLEIVKSLQRQGLVSAMTGDGVNDAPALKEADIGVSMGLEGTEVAKGASDMILTDDNFCSIVKAVEKGRVIYAGIEKFVSFIMSVHFAEVLQIFLCVVSGLPIMRQPLQILFLVLVTDLPPAIALGVEPGEKGIMTQKPRPKTQPVVLPWMWRCIVANGMILTVCIMATYLLALHAYAGSFYQDDIIRDTRKSCLIWSRGPRPITPRDRFYDDDDDKIDECKKYSIRRARTVAFVALVWAENLRAFTARSFTKPVWVNTFNNRAMNKAVLLAQLCLYLGLFVPGLSTAVLGLFWDEIRWFGWVIAVCGAFSCGVGCELYKFLSGFVHIDDGVAAKYEKLDKDKAAGVEEGP
ncbi:hypothetical protein CTAYLR_006531 [Chrysophaeum taylorii]|uniref:Cation-transporting P-type ATPase N-terminal domain-containing protein n=1 Tax=Chrysophaeum taylorii TaxID=2483200 RepID=A0AAD7UFG6_9STRA|nr:hypothetical protein CTAYLR_006531 [Chrysophaeum taylorii]